MSINYPLLTTSFNQVISFLKNTKSFSVVCLFFLAFTPIQSQVIISEVYANNTFKLKNTSASSIDISSYWICNFPTYHQLNTLTIECGNLNLAADAEVVLSIAGLYASNDGELGLYTSRSFSSSTAILSYVEWGSTGHQRATVAMSKEIWDGNAAPAFSSIQSITVSGNGTLATDWSINNTPEFCVVPFSTARYRVTFDATWSRTTHPTDFPSNPHFSRLIGMTHNAAVNLFKVGMLASPGIIAMAEFGANSSLISEINTAIINETGLMLINGGSIGLSPGTVSVEFDINSAYPLVSLTTMIAPSPDWFVGVEGLNLFENGNWTTNKTVQVGVYDAGSDSGASFQSSNVVTNPQETISMITTPPLAVNGVVPSMGTLIFERIDVDVNCLPTKEVADIIETGIYSASATLTSTGTIESGSMVTFRAGESVTLLPDFHAVMGSDFTAKIEDCSQAFIMEAPVVAPSTNTKLSPSKQDVLKNVSATATLFVQPNPVSTIGQAVIDLPQATTVQLTLYNIAGQAVLSLLKEQYKEAGKYPIRFDVTALPNGLYTTVLRTEQEQVIQKILVVSF